jgi:predicted nucleic acid-binding protein
MAFVLDASVAVAWVVPSQATAYTRGMRLRAKREPYHVPEIFAVEVTNVLVSLERRSILSEAGSAAAADVLGRLAPIVHPLDLSVAALRDLANRYKLTAYDAVYLGLAMKLRLPVACGDRPLRAALKAAGVRPA